MIERGLWVQVVNDYERCTKLVNGINMLLAFEESRIAHTALALAVASAIISCSKDKTEREDVYRVCIKEIYDFLDDRCVEDIKAMTVPISRAGEA
jgi:hypothetical protein